ncbi:hypothetical protein Sjap_019448 [Stephania japonica]|uniref:Uncharacterized protein n=1 Tax=Stephania japonica TaxID=461633 RepID=A0AAP0HZQ8_9MAGN
MAGRAASHPFESVHLINTAKIFRESIRILLRHSTHFQSISIFLFSPLSLSLFMSHFLVHNFPTIPSFIVTLLNYLFNHNEAHHIIKLLSKTTVHIIITLPSSITFGLVGRAAAIQAVADSYNGVALNERRLFMRSGLVWIKLLHTCCLEFFIVSILLGSLVVSLAIVPKILLACGVCSSGFGFWAVLAVLGIPFCVGFAHIMVVGNLARVFVVLEDCCGFESLRRAKVLTEGRRQSVLMMVLVRNVGFRLLEFLFDFRLFKGLSFLEGLVLASMYSLVLVLDSITNSVFYHTCKPWH